MHGDYLVYFNYILVLQHNHLYRESFMKFNKFTLVVATSVVIDVKC